MWSQKHNHTNVKCGPMRTWRYIAVRSDLQDFHIVPCWWYSAMHLNLILVDSISLVWVMAWRQSSLQLSICPYFTSWWLTFWVLIIAARIFTWTKHVKQKCEIWTNAHLGRVLCLCSDLVYLESAHKWFNERSMCQRHFLLHRNSPLSVSDERFRVLRHLITITYGENA